MTTVEVLCRAVLPGLSPNAVSKIVHRLCASGYLHKYPLLHPRLYFVLGESAANAHGLSGHRTAPLGPQSLPWEYAILVYATLGKKPRRRLTATELLQKFPWLSPALAHAPYCEEQSQGVLELVRVDLGGPADHVARKCSHDVRDRGRVREFAALITRGGFRLVVITATKEKAVAVRSALDRHEWPDGLLIHFPVIPQLLSLTASKNHA